MPTDHATADAEEIEAQLFTPSPRYLLSLFCQPRLERRVGLEEAAEWFGLNSALASVDPEANLHENVEVRWLDLLDSCGRRLSSQARKRELTALLQALREQAQAANNEERSAVTLDRLWLRTSQILREKLPAGKPGSKHDGADPATLRGRKWGALRSELAEALARLVAQVTPGRLLPREPREPLLFSNPEEVYRSIRARLESEEPGSGLVVIDAESGTGRGELALAYAHWALDQRNLYDRVYVLRANDPMRLEQDFTEMATMIAGPKGNRAQLRRAALEYLEENSRWLIIFSAVQDPAILLQVLPWRQQGHILCTYASRRVEPPADGQTNHEGDGRAEEDTGPWMTYFNVQPVRWEDVDGVATFDAEQELRKVVAVEDGNKDFAELVKVVGGSRHATSLARAWFQYTRPTEEAGSVDFGARQLSEYLQRWRRSAKSVGDANGDENLVGIVAARVLLTELDAPSPWRQRSTETVGLEEATLQLLCRLEPFVDRSLKGSTFQTALLDHEVYSKVDDLINDARIVLLERLALADRAVSAPTRKYFDINSAVLKAVNSYDALESRRRGALASASRTMVNVLSDPPTKREVSDLTFEVLTHIDALALREELSDARGRRLRPLLAAELYAYSALCYLARQRGRTAQRRLERMRKVFDALTTDDSPYARLRIDQLESWEDLRGEEEPVQAVAKRMGKLVKALRMTGFAKEAAEVYARLEPIIERHPERLDEENQRQVARLKFEGAMAYHDLDQLELARELVTDARDVWSVLDVPQHVAMADNFLAEIEFDEGNFSVARIQADSVLIERERLRGAPEGALAKRVADVARSNYLRGRIAYVEGRIEEAESLFEASVAQWEDAFDRGAQEDPAPCFDRINQIASRSYLALMRALLGKARDALEAAENVRYALNETPHRVHAAAQIRANIGQAYRLCGRVIEAASLHQTASDEAARAWPHDHRFNLLVRRKHADSLLAAGRPGEALQLLMDLVRERPDDLATTGGKLRRARVWSTLGRLIVENSLSAPPLLTESDFAYLNLAHRVLTEAKALYVGAGEDDAVNPGMVDCELWLTEIAIRLGEGPQGVDLGLHAVDLAEKQFGQHVPVAAARARLIRAQAIDGADDPAVLEELHSDLAPLLQVVAVTPTDRFEIALARGQVRAASWLLDPHDETGSEVLAEIKDWFEEALEPLYASIGSSAPHQLTARMYAELAAFADRFGLPGQQRARNERERQRLRPRLDLNVSDLSFEIAPMLQRRLVASGPA